MGAFLMIDLIDRPKTQIAYIGIFKIFIGI